MSDLKKDAELSTDYYQQNAATLNQQYHGMAAEQVHANWLHKLPAKPGRALDIGAGNGRDAAWLAKQGWQVTAIEPSSALAEYGRQHCQGLGVDWRSDHLPALTSLDQTTQPYDLILASAVWMHLTPNEQTQALQRLQQLLTPQGMIVISWRNQADDTARQFYPVDVAQFGDAELLASNDQGGRNGVEWRCVVVTNKGNP
ncbi:class I SAM-dependent methyltransferase [Sinobacterium norvegicum]|uniref:class I SAM-dependent methyltransferase n=1 Tax=Sinobacterium norvegicum TaxID=1641715 RepID=UPI001F473E78|nr:class I SAM-dependent methyltransferase [Sinobacterium norvegicum]